MRSLNTLCFHYSQNLTNADKYFLVFYRSKLWNFFETFLEVGTQLG